MNITPRIGLFFGIACVVAIGAFWLVTNSRAATETPKYRVVKADESFEIRDYPDLVVATTPMQGNGMNGSFGQLFRYITGQNEGGQKIEMTSPVLIDTAAEQKTMSFIMPKATVEKGTPKPAGESVSLGKVEAARFAVLRFPGERSEANEKAAVEKLLGWLKEQKITPVGAPMFAYYDPPWTPIPLRRNEVLLRVPRTE